LNEGQVTELRRSPEQGQNMRGECSNGDLLKFANRRHPPNPDPLFEASLTMRG
jgi:hypothetical protein